MDFLTFRSFISIEVLIFFYYMGAVALPLGAWLSALWLLRRYQAVDSAYQAGKAALWRVLNGRQRAWLILFFLFLFLFMELFWRMMFEYLIAYMQIRDALMQRP